MRYWLWKSILTCCSSRNSETYTSSCSSYRVACISLWCQDNLPQWGDTRRSLCGSTRGLRNSRKRTSSLSRKEGPLKAKQSPHAWYGRIDQHFREHGFVRSENEYTTYRKVQENGESLLLSLYIDDIIYTSSSASLIGKFQAKMQKTFEMSDLGIMSYLGLT